ncbi:MAG: hypothetical protein ACREOQ_09155 [Gemmatimonadales bacterium]
MPHQILQADQRQILFGNPTTDPPPEALPGLAEAQGTVRVTITSADGVAIAQDKEVGTDHQGPDDVQTTKKDTTGDDIVDGPAGT